MTNVNVEKKNEKQKIIGISVFVVIAIVLVGAILNRGPSEQELQARLDVIHAELDNAIAITNAGSILSDYEPEFKELESDFTRWRGNDVNYLDYFIETDGLEEVTSSTILEIGGYITGMLEYEANTQGGRQIVEVINSNQHVVDNIEVFNTFGAKEDLTLEEFEMWVESTLNIYDGIKETFDFRDTWSTLSVEEFDSYMEEIVEIQEQLNQK